MLVSFYAGAQVKQFQMYYGTLLNEYFFDMIEYSQGGYVSTGVQYQSVTDGDIYVLRTDADGNQLWAKTFSDPYFQQALGVREDGQGNIIVVGSTRNSTGTGRIFALKLDSGGNMLWTRIYAGTNETQCNSFEKLSGGFIIGGSTYNSDYDACLVKIDSAGTMLWNKSYTIGITDEIVEAIKPQKDGSLLFAGYSMSGPDVSGFLAKADSNGDVLWWKSYMNGRHVIYDFEILPDSSIIMCGEAENFDMLLMKVDDSGSILWEKNYATPLPDQLFHVCGTEEGNIILSGASYFVNGADAGYDMALIKSDTSGSILWTINTGDVYNEQSFGLVKCKDGGFAMCGHYENNNASFLIPPTPMLVKTDSAGFTGCFETVRNYVTFPAAGYDSAITVTSLSPFTTLAIILTAANSGADSSVCQSTMIVDQEYAAPTMYPNPVRDFLFIKGFSTEITTIAVYDGFGKNVFSQKMKMPDGYIDLSALSAGIYLVQITGDTTCIRQRIIKS